MSFDPALVSWRWHGDPAGPLGLALALHYGDRDPIFHHGALGGCRRKFPLRDLGVIVKAQVHERHLVHAAQCWDEAALWTDERLDPIRHRFSPLLAAASSTTHVPQPGDRPAAWRGVSWVAQAWETGRVGCDTFTYAELLREVRTVGIEPSDVAPDQILVRETGEPVWLDFGLWEFLPV